MTTAPRILLYSHDTFGLGHIRRNRKIAGALVTAFENPEVVIATGSKLAASYREQAGVALEHLPAVTKKADGSYGSEDQSVPIGDTIKQRQEKLADIVRMFKPDMLIADKEPMGLLGELEPVLGVLKKMGTKLVLGLRDVLDDPELLGPEWQRKNSAAIIESFYNEIWVYGPADFHDPLAGFDLPPSIRRKQQFLGYLPFENGGTEVKFPSALPEKFVLVTTGGGGDGNALLRAVFAAAEIDGGFDLPVVVLPGPYLGHDLRSDLDRACKALKNISLLDFDPESELLMAASCGVVAMCGYNTFCEVIQLDKPAMFVPRETPRREQLVRATRASELGLCTCLRIGEAENARHLRDAIMNLPLLPPPSSSDYKPDFGGVERLASRAKKLLGQGNS